MICGILVYTCVMALVNCSVYNPSEKCVVSPWKIMAVGASGRAIKQYFAEVVGKDVINSGHTVELVGAFLGRSKEQLDEVDISVPLDMAVQYFGGFLRYHVSSCGTPQEPQRSRVDAFQLMMSSVRQQSVRLPRKKEPPRNQKDKLFNAVVDLLEEQKLSSPAEAVIWTEPCQNVD